MAKLSRAEITAKTIEIIHNCVPELQGVELTEASVVNTDMSMDSMSFIAEDTRSGRRRDREISEKLTEGSHGRQHRAL